MSRSSSDRQAVPAKSGKTQAGKTQTGQLQHDAVWQDADWRRSLRRRLLHWFSQNARDLPWRRDTTLYRVWVSEIMCQQTQVATVIPYFERFLDAFPDIASLAAAEEQKLLGLWEGLGYYRRARSMHAAAKKIMEQHGGEFPESFEEVIDLPGVGRYTAGAILSISRQAKLPILEGNTQRVFSRWVALRGAAPVEPPATRLLWEIAETLLPRKRAGDFNQAAMELGALVCTPKQPACDICPVNGLCAAQARGLTAEIPGKLSKIKYVDRTEFALVIAQAIGDEDRQFLVRQIPAGGRWEGLWDFPRLTEDALASADQAADQLSRELGVSVSAGSRLTVMKHAVTRYRISLQVHEATLGDDGEPPPAPWKYCSLAEIEQLPMSVTGRQIAQMLGS
ncbi:MAG: A/G-specific adenine glycosylase [Rubripirellula sp.]|nr:A/G-specific adenine glycosylase [Rubripirellula sp.]